MSAITSIKAANIKVMPWIVWALRLLIGGVFVMSGFVKAIDLWGFVYKTSEYFMVWDIPQPHSLYVMIALSLSMAEFMIGCMLVIGAYRRLTVWAFAAMMAGLLPLTVYIYFKSPVADCGCFGDFWILSNGATLFKNILLTLGCVYLLFFNKKVKGLFSFGIQWIPALGCFVYLLAVSLYGYNVQPLIDFRSFPVGSDILVSESDREPVVFEFVYEKDGKRQSFSEDNLPDSTWTFVDRNLVSGSLSDATELVIYDYDDDVTSEVIDTVGEQLLIILPDYSEANVSYTYTVNEFQEYIEAHGGSLIEIAAIPDDGQLEEWTDLSMATYPIYRAESTVLKELARGVMAAVYIKEGKIVWKRSLSSIDNEVFERAGRGEVDLLESLVYDGGRILRMMTLMLLGWLLMAFVIDTVISRLKKRPKSQGLKKNE